MLSSITVEEFVDSISSLANAKNEILDTIEDHEDTLYNIDELMIEIQRKIEDIEEKLNQHEKKIAETYNTNDFFKLSWKIIAILFALTLLSFLINIIEEIFYK